MKLRTLMHPQRMALDWAKDRTAIALFMQMRLGKTTAVIRWLRQRRSLVNLIVAPVTTLRGWQLELAREGTPLLSVVRIDGTGQQERTDYVAERFGSKPPLGELWFLVNYEAIRVWLDGPSFPWDAVVLDESTKIKNPQAKVTKVLLRKYDGVEHRAILTGLPNPESDMDFFSQMQFVNGGTFMGFNNFWAWREALFFQVGYDWLARRGKDGKPGTRQKIKDAVGELAFLMTRKEAKVGSVLLHEVRTVPMNAEQRRMWKQVTKDFKINEQETKSAGAQFVWQQRIAGGFSPDRTNPGLVSEDKYNEIVSLLKGELKGESLVIWFHFNEELAYVLHSLRDAGFKASFMTGATPVKYRDSRQDDFSRQKFQVFCIQEALGQYGLDLSVSDTEIYYSNSYSYEIRAQSQDRIIHARKTHPLLAIDLVTEGTTDEDVVDVLRDKGTDSRSFHSKLLAKIRERMAS